MKVIGVVMVSVFLFATASLAQRNSTEGQADSLIVEEVRIVRNRRIPQSVIHPLIKTRKGEKYTPAQLDKDLRAIFDTGHFDNVICFAEDGSHGGKIVTFELVEKPLIFGVTFEGLNSERQSEVLAELSRQKLEFVKGDEYTHANLKQAAAVIRAFLKSKGYENVSVVPMVEPVGQTEVKISFKIKL
jgi:outer membrane protein assembly factor BamA